MVAAYQSAKNWYPVTLVKTLIKKEFSQKLKEHKISIDLLIKNKLHNIYKHPPGIEFAT